MDQQQAAEMNTIIQAISRQREIFANDAAVWQAKALVLEARVAELEKQLKDQKEKTNGGASDNGSGG